MVFITLFVSSMFLAFTLLPYLYMISPPPTPVVQLDKWWGPENETASTDIVQFQIQFDNATITDLKNRLSDAHFVTPLEGIGFEYGFNGNRLREVLNYWANEYPFSQREAFFNTYQHFRTNIQGLHIHFMKVSPQVPAGVEKVPMLMLHGWPGSIREFYATIPFLTAVNSSRNFAMELIMPSLPGFGFSSGAVRPGLGADEIAVVCRNLMHRLGYQRYYVQGGDYGGIITKYIATLFPEDVIGLHSNFPLLLTPKLSFYNLLDIVFPSLDNDTSENSTSVLSERFYSITTKTGYLHLQCTRPDTIGVALVDSPASLAAYIIEKFAATLNSTDGGITKYFTLEQLLDNVMVYYINKAMTTAIRLYAETFNIRQHFRQLDQIPSPVPTVVTQAERDISYTPTWALKLKFPNLISNTLVKGLGHFQAFERPELFAQLVIAAVADIREWHANNSTT